MFASALSWYYRSFLCGFCYHLPLLLGLLFPVVMMLGNLGDEYGPRSLLFHESPQRAIVAGLSIGFFWLELLFIGYLLWLRDRREGRLTHAVAPGISQSEVPSATVPVTTAAEVPPHTFLGYAARTAAAAAVTCLIIFLVVWAFSQMFQAIEDVPDRPTDLQIARGFHASGVACFVFGLLLSLGAAFVVARLRRPDTDLPNVPVSPDVPANTPGSSDTDPPPLSEPHAVLSVPMPEMRARRKFKIVEFLAARLIIFFWLVMVAVVVLDWNGEKKDLAAVVLALVGLVATMLFWFRPTSRWLGRVAGIANALLGYMAVTWCISRCPFGLLAGVLVALGWGLCLHFAVRSARPDAENWITLAFRRATVVMDRRESGYLRRGIVYLLVGSIILLITYIVPWLASAVPAIVLMLVGGFAVYGLFAYLIRRSLVPVGLLLGFLMLIANVQQYKLRFDGLPYYTHNPQSGILDLKATAQEDADRLDEFDDDIARYRAIQIKLDETREQLATANQLLLGKLQDAPLDASQIDGVKQLVKDLTAKEARLTARHQAQLQTVQRKWMELNANRVLAPRVPAGVGLDKELPIPFNPTTGLIPTNVLQSHNRHLSGTSGAKGPLIVIAVSGGGLRSAIWTYFVLEQLEIAFARQGLDFPSHVRLISGASGGMLGASYYVCTLTPPEKRPKLEERAAQLQTQRKKLGSDFLYPLTRRAVLSDLPGLFSPWPMKYDRGKALEAEWQRQLIPADPNARGLEQKFADLRQGELEGWRPSLVFTPMMVEDGRRLVISNLDMRYATSNDGFVVGGKNTDKFQANHSVDALELFRMFPQSQSTLSVATAARMSASFPYFSPGVSLPTHPRRRVVDAGYYDNYGVCLASAWLLRGSTVGWLTEKANRVLVIQIRDGTSVDQRQLREVPPDGSGLLSRALEEASTPLEGLFSARVSSSSFRNDGSLTLLETSLLPGLDPRNLEKNLPKSGKESAFAIANFELAEGNVSLSWYLTRDQIGWIVGEAHGSPNKARVEKLAAEITDYCNTIQAP